MKLYSVVLEVPENLDISQQDEEGNYLIGNDVMYQLSKLFVVYPGGISSGTKIVDGKKIVNAVIRTPSTEPYSLAQALIITFDLPWKIKGFKTFDAPEPVYDGEEIIRYKAKIYMSLSDDVIPYINKIEEEQPPIYDDSVPPEIIGYQPITQFPFTEYEGGSKWE